MSTRFFVPCITSYHCRRKSALSFALRRQIIDAGTSFFSVPASVSRFAQPGRIQMKRDARKAPAGLRASLYNLVFSKRKELTTDPRFRISVVNLISIRAIFSNLNLVQAKKSLFLLRISCFQDLIPPSQSALDSNLPGGRGEIDDETSGQSVSASISSAFPEREQIRGLSGILVIGV